MIIDTYKTAIGNFHFGEGSARAVMIVLILGVFSLAYLKILERVNKHYGVK
jgi:multiple sugar transport system permease protein